MRQLTYLILTIVILASCSNDKTSTDKNASQVESLKQNLIPIFKGVWLLSDYIEAIDQTKSPLRSADKLKDVVTMVIDGTSQSDSMEVSASLNNHEGYNFTTYFLAGQNQNSVKTSLPDYGDKSNFYELGYETTNDQTFLFLYHYNKENKLIDKKKFSKVAGKQPDNNPVWGLQYMVNEKLFSGNYLLIDSTNATTKISLKGDGSLTGHPDFQSYYVSTDFMGEPGASLDEIEFNLNEKNAKSFAFKISNDTTYLYSMTGDEQAGESLQLGKIQCKLVRQ